MHPTRALREGRARVYYCIAAVDFLLNSVHLPGGADEVIIVNANTKMLLPTSTR